MPLHKKRVGELPQLAERAAAHHASPLPGWAAARPECTDMGHTKPRWITTTSEWTVNPVGVSPVNMVGFMIYLTDIYNNWKYDVVHHYKVM